MSNIETQLLENLNEFVGFARHRLADPELAADAVQESLLKALKAADQVRDHESTKAWFYRILRRTIIDLYRRRDVQERAVARMQRELDAPGTAEEERVACGCLEKLIPTLRPQYTAMVQERHHLLRVVVVAFLQLAGVLRDDCLAVPIEHHDDHQSAVDGLGRVRFIRCNLPLLTGEGVKKPPVRVQGHVV